MVRRLLRYCALVVVSVLCTPVAQSQPLLPDITCSVTPAGVYLCWDCTFDKVQRIVVRRSANKVADFEEIGLVASVAKGVQHFTDNKPIRGVSYYKLSVVFSSGVKWSSNTCMVTIDGELPATSDGSSFPGQQSVQGDVGRDVPRSSVRLKLPPVRQETDFDERHWVQPVHVMVHPGHGNVVVTSGRDWNSACYTISFFDNKGRQIVYMPFLHGQQCIIDKRNFQQKGTFRYVLRRNGFEIENAYIEVDPGRVK